MACDPDRRYDAYGTPGGYARVLIGIVCGYNVYLREKKKGGCREDGRVKVRPEKMLRFVTFSY